MFKPYRMLIGLALVAGLSFHGQTLAQAGKGALQVRNEAFLEKTVTAADGKTRTERVPAGKVVPGQEVLYVITVSNVSSSPADRTARPSVDVAALLSGPDPADDRALVALARALDSLESDLHREVTHP